MAAVGLLNAYGSTVGDNLEHHLIAEAIKSQGYQVRHFCNFARQKVQDVMACQGLVAGCGGILWKGSPLRDTFFIDVIRVARRAIGCSIGYNQGEPLEHRWIQAVNSMEYVGARDTWTLKWIRENCDVCARCHPSVAWTYKPPGVGVSWAREPIYDLGLIINRRAFEINVGTGNPWKLYPGIKGLKVLEIPFAQPVEQPYTKTTNNDLKRASVASLEIQKCRAVYTQRLHGFILALLNGVPAICHGGGFKVQSQADLIGWPLLRIHKQLQALDPEGWQALIREGRDLNPRAYAARAAKEAARHILELEKWLEIL